MAHDINVKEVIDDKQSWFNIKRFKIGNVDFDRPLKTLDSKVVSQKAFNSFGDRHSFRLAEETKIIKSYAIIDKLYEEDDNQKINATS